ncbi:MAG: hypothetical protein J0L61_08515 [Planctomycetes bacterium]|nr:hypothetical protein [Planctomycetota bacterium]
MSLALDAVYGVVAAVTMPWWMRKARSGWAERFGKGEALPPPREGTPRLLLHTVSVGETNLVRPLVERLSARADVVVSASTDTGIERARTLYASRAAVVRYPLDASWSVRRFLDRVRPDAVALVELELWPNFATECRRRGIPLAVINGRLSARSFSRYRKGRAFIGRYFRQLAFAAVQDRDYAGRFVEMGVARDRCHVIGTMKWDAADVSGSVPGADALAEEMGIDRSRPLIVAGSTAPGEHEALHAACPPGVQLLCAPRRPEWFDQAAAALGDCSRRSSRSRAPAGAGRFLLDTIGELRKAYALCDVAVVGRSFGTLYGSDPMEPAALGKPVVIGPSVADFAATVDAMKTDGAIIQTPVDGLAEVLRRLIERPTERTALGERARRCVLAHQGATARHADLLLDLLKRRAGDGGAS